MYIKPEIIILFFIISFLIYTMPNVLVKFSKSCKGKFLLLVLTIMITLYNRIGGLIMVMFFIFLAEFNYEFNNDIIYEGFGNNLNNHNKKNDEEEHDEENDNNQNKEDELLLKINNKDKLNTESELRPRNSSNIIQ